MLDVAVVGFGPVGQALAALLGEAGHRVEVFEPHTDIYPQPRAVHLDGEALRLFDRLGIVEEIEDDLLVVGSMELYGADGGLVSRQEVGKESETGWLDCSFYQPVLERAMAAKVEGQENSAIRRGWKATGLSQHPDHVELSVSAVDEGAGSEVVEARYVVGADGARSTIRQALGIEMVDFGFDGRWVVADVRPDRAHADRFPAVAVGHLDPARPFVAVPNGRTHRRWEFMILDGETDEEFSAPERVWELLSPHVSPEEATLERHTVYEFTAQGAGTMGVGRVFLAGDSAHVMPPFAGQGLCSGLRDANSLAWRLDLVLRGLCGPQLLDGYGAERKPQDDRAIQVSTMGAQMICIVDPDIASARDQAMRGGPPPPMVVPPLSPDGLVARVWTEDPVAGKPSVQGRVERDGVVGLLDRVVGPGFSVVCRGADPAEILSEEQSEFLDGIGAKIVTLAPGRTSSVADTDGTLTRWLTGLGLEGVVCRPDGHAFGGARSDSELGSLIDELRERIAYLDHDASLATASEERS